MATIRGTSKKNTLRGTGSNDSIFGLGGNDQLFGKTGNDRLFGGAGNDKLFGGNGNDRLEGGNGNDRLEGGSGKDRLEGGNGSDALFGNAGNDSLFGGAGNDGLRGGAGADRLDGGSGNDTVDYSDSPEGINVHLSKLVIDGSGNILPVAADGSTAFGGHAEGDVIAGVENLIGSQHNDILIGGNGANALGGLAGGDQMAGLAGADILFGGAGNDFFVYLNGTDSPVGSGLRDVILDFVQGQDRVQFSFDAQLGIAGSQDFQFIGSFEFGNDGESVGELRFVNNIGAGITVIQGDFGGDGNFVVDFEVELIGIFNLGPGDIIV